jgi:hypothetical protein
MDFKMIKTNHYYHRSYLILSIVLLASPLFVSWGEAGHLRINRAAVFSLPESMRPFFYNHIDYITQASPGPDIRRFLLDDRSENSRHYFDLENYGQYDSLPATLAIANTQYSKDFLSKNGILPWYIIIRMEDLTKAFKEKRKSEILFLAADLGHYVADANTPLHTTVNYDGQLTGQNGIHAFWETRLVKLFSEDYDYYSGEARYIADIPLEIGNMIKTSNALADSLLNLDLELKKNIPTDLLNKTLQKDTLNKVEKPVWSDDYARYYHEALKGMVERQIRKSIIETSSFWYTAWVNAGKPNLSELDPADQTARNRKELKNELKLYHNGKLVDVKP